MHRIDNNIFENGAICSILKELDIDKENYDDFKAFFKAILSVGQEYISYKNPFSDDPHTKGAYKNHVERVFAYELYHQWSMTNTSCLCLNAEVQKYVRKRISYKSKDNGHKTSTTAMVYPDLVFHGGQQTFANQKIVCEIKREEQFTGNKNAIFADLLKLSCFTDKENSVFLSSNKNHYDYGAFLIVGEKVSGQLTSLMKIKSSTTIKLIEKRVKQKISFETYKADENYRETFKRIICIAYDGKALEVDTLENCLKNK